jgi:ArsR family transcriptional regulator
MASQHPDPRILARRFHALGDEIRLDVLQLLRDGERCVCELTAVLLMAQSRLSFHLKVLKDSGLIVHRKAGRWSYYTLDAEAFREVESFLRAIPNSATSSASPAPCCQPARPPAAAAAPTPKRSCNDC